ncbi:ferritin-like domain-containing protein [Pontibacillus litoralis]|uniref:DUF2383 domain-containing protein n=1 Tax=Pontibacillus litoralis JSM 072002 TaxID=1385512 RepID=A0A0A5HPP4_9BACI|nr:ferritin-like domain-containing protein [Pontibacillus litoralis]KGX85587.1 hypothetical protein N784_08745 [Pontibacillus litoralis JSM 072002]
MEKTNILKTLNKFLQGQYMGIHAYEDYIQKVNDHYVRKEFQAIQQQHKRNAEQVAEHIQNLGGKPVDDEGFVGAVTGFIGRFQIPDDTDEIVRSALKGETKYGIEMSEEMVAGKLDKESRRIIKEIIDMNRKHVEILNQMKHR